MKSFSMKITIFVCLYTVASAFYTDVDEQINLEKVLNDPEELRTYVDCALDKGPCTETMDSYKKHFNEAIDNACADCSPNQKHIAEEFIKAIIKQYPEDLEDIQKKYDPDGTRVANVLAELAKY